ncbi:EAL domain-containing protein [uncultured Massilia sp.]|uniref:EAL domain-containing response regulator n=1 Tax=uncultured Massilia sp. TaxID=169973 RepID=UPI0025F2EB5B|nr:EAL domain-containing response regulator [uncultured Massilia sp.]
MTPGLPPFPVLAPLRVLVLEDNPFERRVLTTLLKRLGVGRVDEVGSGDAALARLRTHAFDVVLCDLQVRDLDCMDGIEFLRSAAPHLDCPLILVSGIDEDLAIAAEVLAQSYGLAWGGRLRKPVLAAELRPLLEACTVRRAGAARLPPEAARRRWSKADLRMALKRGQFVPWFQPQYGLATGKLFGAEALARWVHPDAGLVLPGDFVPLMEREGMVDALFDAMLDGVLDAMAGWSAAGVHVPVSINASPLTLENVHVPNLWRRRVEARGVDPGTLTIEVTETAIANDFPCLLESITRLRMHGFRVSLDDFGTSHSSLQQMSELPATEVKIDRSFVGRALRHSRTHLIFRSIVDLGRRLGMTVVAEGVETRAQHAFVHDMGCDAAQGWLHGRPMPPDQLHAAHLQGADPVDGPHA